MLADRRKTSKLADMARIKTPTADTLAGHIAREIRGEMGRQGITQESLADQLGWTQRLLSRRLTAEVPIDAKEIEDIANVLGVPLTQLLPAEELR